MKARNKYGIDTSTPEGHRAYCLEWYKDHKEYARNYYQKNKDRITLRCTEWRKNNRLHIRKWHRDYAKQYRIKCLEHYAGKPPKCSCCGETMLEFLCLDHINGAGKADRRMRNRAGTSMYAHMVRHNDFPKDLQVLCHNCNMAKGFYGICPHQDKSRVMY